MPKSKLTKSILSQIDAAVKVYVENRDDFKHLAKTLRDDLVENKNLRKFIHSTKFRAKKPDSLHEKLKRQAIERMEKGKPFEITKDNLFSQITDLAGVRILHLHTKQMSDMHSAILDIFQEYMYRVVRKPVAYTWDFENKQLFEDMGLKTNMRRSMYTSIHYVVEPNRRTKYRCELQVRTLMEEVWGEVSHTINYPDQIDSVTCQEQLRVLARVASGCTRLVDSIFLSYIEHGKLAPKKPGK
ncbi:MAG: RelA/SpoT domain-containing protein [Desulfobacterales bacterium]|nr:RelA/SpoT domain-containing protein [Desulfobacterales bacterium]